MVNNGSKIQIVGTDNEGVSFTEDWCTIVNFDGEFPHVVCGSQTHGTADYLPKSSVLKNTSGAIYYFVYSNGVIRMEDKEVYL